MTTSESVRQLAFNAFLEVRKPPGWQLVERDGVAVLVHDLPIALIAHPRSGLLDVPTAVAAARDIAREHGRTSLVWMLNPEHDDLRPHLERAGLINQDAPGFESVENILVLEEPPAGDVGADVEVDRIRSIEDIDACHLIRVSAFGLPEGASNTNREAAWQQMQDPSYPLVQWVARLDGRAVGCAGAVDAEHGVNLFGGAVTEAARGHGVYRALVAKRWEFAVELGKPALTVQAGRMSGPILERLGFRKLGEQLVYDDPMVTTID